MLPWPCAWHRHLCQRALVFRALLGPAFRWGHPDPVGGWGGGSRALSFRLFLVPLGLLDEVRYGEVVFKNLPLGLLKEGLLVRIVGPCFLYVSFAYQINSRERLSRFRAVGGSSFFVLRGWAGGEIFGRRLFRDFRV